MSRLHGVADGTTVGGDVHTVITAIAVDTVTAATVTTATDTTTATICAANCSGISGDSAGGA